MSIRVLMVGADSDYAIERPYRKYLSGQPGIASLQFFPAQNLFLDYYRENILNKILYRIGLSRILKTVNDKLIGLVEQSRPDVILVFKGMEIFPSTLRLLKGQGIKLVNFNPDNPFVFSGKGSGNANITRSISLYDLYLSYDPGVCGRLIKDYSVNSKLLPFGFDISEEMYQKCAGVDEVIRPCFIGNADNRRLAFLNALAGRGFEIDVYGMDWKRRKLHSNIHLKGYAASENLWINLRRYRVQLNLMRLHNPDSHNMRSFEIPAVGGIQLAPETPDHGKYFEPGKEIFLYRDADDCAVQIRHLLSLDSAEALKIRNQARRRSLDSGYSYEARAQLLSSMLMSLCPEAAL